MKDAIKPEAPRSIIGHLIDSFEREIASTNTGRDHVVADWILACFDFYYSNSRKIPSKAQQAFELGHANRSLELSRNRLSMYSEVVHELGVCLADTVPEATQDEAFWSRVERLYLPQIKGRYEADLAFAFVHSARRRVYKDVWEPVEYTFSDSTDFGTEQLVRAAQETVWLGYPVRSGLTLNVVKDILSIPHFERRYRGFDKDAALVLERLSRFIEARKQFNDNLESLEMIQAGFYRNRGAYLVGRMQFRKSGCAPLIVALLNSQDGIYVDAVLTTEADAHNVFSSTLANFHVTSHLYQPKIGYLTS